VLKCTDGVSPVRQHARTGARVEQDLQRADDPTGLQGRRDWRMNEAASLGFGQLRLVYSGTVLE